MVVVEVVSSLFVCMFASKLGDERREDENAEAKGRDKKKDRVLEKEVQGWKKKKKRVGWETTQNRGGPPLAPQPK
ncbi:hypothetical protein FF1_038133 [Malus domestica]